MIKLLKRMKKHEVWMALICILLVLGQIYFDLALPDYMSDLTLVIKTPGSTVSQILQTGLKMLGCTLASALLSVICGYLAARVAAGFSYTLRDGLFTHVMDLGQQEMHKFSVPSLITRTTNDITQIQMLIAMGLQILVKAPVMAVWAVIKIINKSWTLSAITAGFVVVLLTLMGVIFVLVMPRFKLVQKQIDGINRVARENLNGINVVHAYNAENYQNRKLGIASEALMRTQLFNQRAFALLLPAVTLVMNALSLVIYWVGAALVNAVPAADMITRLTTFSNVVVFGSYAAYVIMSLMMMVMIMMFLPSAQVSAERINEVLNTDSTLKPGSADDSTEAGTVEFRNVCFRYPESGQDELSNINLRVKAGQTVAFIGATGSGKTTLVSLAARFYDATSGEVLIDGRDVRDYSFDALYNRIAFVTQRAVLFKGDIRQNILFGESRGSGDDAAAKKAIDLAQADEFIDKMSEGMLSPIVQGGTNVSGGQKQRISIARALARNPEILIFDDSFSALDYRTDAKLRAGLKKQLEGVTCLIVAQRIGTIRHADQIFVLDDGMIVGRGTHAELMENCDVYREIAMSQLSPEELQKEA